MLSLSLKNFRCWEDKKIDFPIEGCILLDGKSGIGKTTLLNAILYAITGKLTKVSTFGKKHTSVELTFTSQKTIKILRTHTPILLRVTISHPQEDAEALETSGLRDQRSLEGPPAPRRETLEYTGNEAQAIIDNFFGTRFSNICYIEQDSGESFVQMTPARKMEFLQELLLKEYGIDSIMSRVKNETSSVKDGLTSEMSKINTLKSLQYTEPHIHLEKPLTVGGCLINSSNFLQTSEKIRNNVSTTEKNLLTCENNRRKFEKNQNIKKILDGLIEEKKELESKISGERLGLLEIQQNSYLKNKEYTKIKQKLTDTRTKFEKYKNKQTNDLEILKKEFGVTSLPNTNLLDLNKQLYLYKKLCELDDVLLDDDKAEELSNNIKELSENIQMNEDLLRKKEDSTHFYTCPSCTTSLKLDKDKLVLFDTETVEVTEYSADDLRKELKKDKKKIEEFLFKQNLNLTNKECYEKNYIELETQLPSDKWEEIENTILYIQKHQKILDDPTLPMLTREIEELSRNLDMVSSEVSDSCISEDDFVKNAGEIAVIRDCMSRLIVINKNIEKHEKDYIFLDTTQDILDEKVSSCREKLTVYKKYLEELISWEHDYRQREKNHKLEKDIIASEKIYLNLSEKLKGLNKLREYIKEAERRSVDDFIDSLNLHAGIYIAEMFPDQDLEVKLKSVQKDKISLNFEVNYRQMINCDISILSGGERDRVNLAYTLAFSEITSSKILMLDECISSLDEENSSIVLKTLSEKYKGLIICVCHQTIQGAFNHTIKL